MAVVFAVFQLQVQVQVRKSSYIIIYHRFTTCTSKSTCKYFAVACRLYPSLLQATSTTLST